MPDSATGTTNADNVVGVAAGVNASRLEMRDDAPIKARSESAALRLRILRVRTLTRVRVLK